MVPGPVTAVVLLFSIDAGGEEKRKREDARIATDGRPMLDETYFLGQADSELYLFLESVTECLLIFFLDSKCMRDYRTFIYTCTGKCAYTLFILMNLLLL